MKVTGPILSYFILLCGVDSFTSNVRSPFIINNKIMNINPKHIRSGDVSSNTRLFITIEDSEKQDSEIDRLKSMAAKLRAEASALEAEKAATLAIAAQNAFEKFDINKDGEISLSELKAGLEKEFKTELSQARVEALMKSFDDSGDGALQLEEFVTVNQFRNKLDALARDEKDAAVKAKKEAATEEAKSKAAEAILEQINDKPPSNTDKILSVIPYLFPLLDGLQFGRFLIQDGADSNPLVQALALLYIFYRSIPFGGFVAFFALSTLSGNFGINRLIRYNMQQAIYLDIALFFPGLIAALGSVTGFKLPAQITELGTDAVFAVLLLTLTYCVISSVLGQIPDKLPLISDAVNQRIPTADSIDISLFDDVIDQQKKDDDEKNKKD